MADGTESTKGSRSQPWRLAIAAVVGLLVVIVVDSLVGLVINRQVEQITHEALLYDIELEDEADDLRVAVLDLRHYHRNLAFTGSSRGGIADWERAYAALQEELDELERIGVRDADAPQPEQIRAVMERYYADFRPALDRYEVDRDGFTQASDRGLVLLAELDGAGETLDTLGEQLAAASLVKVEQATSAARVVLLVVLGGIIPIGVVLAYAAVRMVGELRELYAGQQAAAEALAEAGRVKTDFLADMSHELRTPLTVLRGNAEVGLALDRDWAHRDLLQEIVKESTRMARMVEDLLFLVRTDAAPPPLQVQRVALAPFLAELAGRAEVLAREHGATFQARLAGSGWHGIDAARIEQVVLILVDNAAKYSPAGGCITLSAGTSPEGLWIEVADQGPGIPEAELPHVFERFYRVGKRRERRQDGTGLGLSIAKTIVEAHGGHIQAVSRVGEGTQMTLVVPLAMPSTCSRQAPEESPPYQHQ